MIGKMEIRGGKAGKPKFMEGVFIISISDDSIIQPVLNLLMLSQSRELMQQTADRKHRACTKLI